MENDIVVAKNADLEQEKLDDCKVLDPISEPKPHLSADGSKDSDDDVFEEAIESVSVLDPEQIGPSQNNKDDLDTADVVNGAASLDHAEENESDAAEIVNGDSQGLGEQNVAANGHDISGDDIVFDANDGKTMNAEDANRTNENSINSNQRFQDDDVPHEGYTEADTSEFTEVTGSEKLEQDTEEMQVHRNGDANGSVVPESGPPVDSDSCLPPNREEMAGPVKHESSAADPDSDVKHEDMDASLGPRNSIASDNGQSERNGDHHSSSEASGEREAPETKKSDSECVSEVGSMKKENLVTNGTENGAPGHEVKHADDIQSSSRTFVSENGAPKPSSSGATVAAASTNPAGLGRGPSLLQPSTRVVAVPRANGAVSAARNHRNEGTTNGEAEEYDETREKLQMIRVKFLRLAHRLGQTPHNVVVAQVLYRLGLAEQLHGRSGGRVAAFSFDRASAMAEHLEAAGQEPLDFTCTILVLGKSGVGKSATINSIFDESMFSTDAFQLGTKKVQDIVGTVQGIRVRVIDTPGLLSSWTDQRQNERTLLSVKKFIKKTPPDIVLYLDRLDTLSRDFADMPLLQTITETFGPSIWFNAIVVLTHAASAPPEGPNGTPTTYDMFVSQRSLAVQQAIRQAAGDTRLMNPVSLVENHSACRTNRAGQRVLPNGQVWKPHLLLLSFASKILAEANTLLRLQDTPTGRPFAARARSPPLPFLLSSLLQSRSEVKLPADQFGDDDNNDAGDDDVDEGVESDEASEYDELPPFKALTKAEIRSLSKLQRKAYYDELEYREKLFMKKQLREERKQRRMMRKMREAANDFPADVTEEDASGAASVPVPMADLTLPASFDSDTPTHRYRSLDSSSLWLVRALLEPNGWDHDVGFDSVNVERLFVVRDAIPISFSGNISKDKKDANLQMEAASTIKHGHGKATSLGFEMKSVGKDYAYTVRSESKFSSNRINKAAAGFSATLLGDTLSGGMKIEDKLMIGKQGQVIVSGGAIYGKGEVACGGSLEATIRDKDHPFGRFLSTFGISVMDWHGDLAVGCNFQTQVPVGRHSNVVGCFNLNNRGSGQFSVRMNSSEQLQIVLVGLIPVVRKVLGFYSHRFGGSDH